MLPYSYNIYNYSEWLKWFVWLAWYCFFFQDEILQLSERYVKSLAKETENTIDGPYSGRLTGYGKYLLLEVDLNNGHVCAKL